MSKTTGVKNLTTLHFSMTISVPWHPEGGAGQMPSLKFEVYDVMIVRFGVKYPTISLAPSVPAYMFSLPPIGLPETKLYQILDPSP